MSVRPLGRRGAAQPVNHFIFANPAHDFPQRIGYRRATRDSIIAWIDGPVGGKTKMIEFPYTRASCEAE